MPGRVRHGLILAIVGCLCTAMFAPVATLADTNLEVGGEAVVAYANGDDVRFRDAPDYGGAVLDMVPEGTWVDVFYGPITADDGSIWYNVGLDGQEGYILADFLAVPDGSGGSVPANATVLDAEGSASADGIAAGTVVAVAVIAGTNGDGVRCRTDASSGSAIITVLPEGTSVELTGDAIDNWQPVNCAGQGGFVHTEFVSYDGSGVETDTSDSTDTVAAASDESDGATFGAASVTGTAMVGDTQGDGLRCRASASFDANVLTVLREGSSLDLRGDAQDEWQPVVCAGSDGYVSAQYVDYDGTGSSDDSGSSGDEDVTAAESVGASTGIATIGDTQGDGLRCRSRATFDASVIVVLSEGSTVELRGSSSGVWQPITCGDSKGWVHTDYLVYDGGASGGDVDDADADGSSGGGSVTGSAFVGDTQGDGLRCRSSASFDSSIITVLSEGSTLQLRGDASNGWQPVLCDGSNGFVSSDYVSFDSDGGSSGGGSSSGGGDEGSSGGSNSGLSAGDSAEVTGTNGDGVRFRSSASSSGAIISVLGEGTVVDVRSGSKGDWVAVSYNGSNGFVHMDYLSASDGSSGGSSNGGGSSSNDDDDSSGGGGGGGLSDGDHAVTSSTLNLRYEASMSSGVAAVAPGGTVVLITGGISNGFYPIDWDGLSGFMHSDYLSATNADLSERGGSGTAAGDGNGVSDGGGGGDGGSSGSAVVNYAMNYVGYPYVWATHGPSSFDCSGFTYWVVLNTLGMDIGTGTFSQASSGRSVARGDLQPGDLVFFQNTYTWGLSHVGIYIGNDQFVHAENESTGVKTSSLSSDYYASRWYGAVRLT